MTGGVVVDKGKYDDAGPLVTRENCDAKVRIQTATFPNVVFLESYPRDFFDGSLSGKIVRHRGLRWHKSQWEGGLEGAGAER